MPQQVRALRQSGSSPGFDMEINKTGFDNALYIEKQSAEILRRADRFGKLYMEVGGKLFQDLHAERVLPGFDPDVKIRMMQNLGDRVEVVICVHAGDVEHRKYRGDFGTTYDNEVLRLIDEVRRWGIPVRAVVVTRFNPEMKAAAGFVGKLRHFGIKVVTHSLIPGYPENPDMVLSEEGCGKNDFVETERPIVAVIGPGPSSGKFATCLNQVYHEFKRGRRAGYAKYETFPVWNLPLDHPVNIAYEAATADLFDINEIDSYHMKAYGRYAVNYNRDIEAFPVMQALLTGIMSPDAYKSPTDMGVNCVGFAITDDDVVRRAAGQEVIRRRFQTACEILEGRCNEKALDRVDGLLAELNLKLEDRAVVQPARKAAAEAKELGKGFNGIYCGAAIQLHDGTIITGKNSPMMHAASSMLLNALKHLAGLPDWLHLIPEPFTHAITNMKEQTFRQTASNLDVAELLIAIGISSANSNAVMRAVETLVELRDCDVHLSHMAGDGDSAGLRRLGVSVTCDPVYPSQNLFME